MPRFSKTVVDHFSSPRNTGRFDHPDSQAFVGSPVCGDQVLLSAMFQEDHVTQARFEARGCAASLALGSLLTTEIPGWTLEQCRGIGPEQVAELLGGLAPEHQHVAQLGADLLHRLARNLESGALDDGTASCS